MGDFNHDEYLKDYKKRVLTRLTIDMKKEKRAEIQRHADMRGETLTGYIKKAVDMRMKLEDKEAAKNMPEWEPIDLGNPFGEAMEQYARMDRGRKTHRRW